MMVDILIQQKGRKLSIQDWISVFLTRYSLPQNYITTRTTEVFTNLVTNEEVRNEYNKTVLHKFGMRICYVDDLVWVEDYVIVDADDIPLLNEFVIKASQPFKGKCDKLNVKQHNCKCIKSYSTVPELSSSYYAEFSLESNPNQTFVLFSDHLLKCLNYKLTSQEFNCRRQRLNRKSFKITFNRFTIRNHFPLELALTSNRIVAYDKKSVLECLGMDILECLGMDINASINNEQDETTDEEEVDSTPATIKRKADDYITLSEKEEKEIEELETLLSSKRQKMESFRREAVRISIDNALNQNSFSIEQLNSIYKFICDVVFP
jgi:hypothetical protein